MQPFCGELKEGMEIKSNDISNYKGIVLEVRYEYGKQVQAYIAREDKRTGGGKVFPEYGPSWQIRRTWNNQWGSDGLEGSISVLTMLNWKQRLENKGD